MAVLPLINSLISVVLPTRRRPYSTTKPPGRWYSCSSTSSSLRRPINSMRKPTSIYDNLYYDNPIYIIFGGRTKSSSIAAVSSVFHMTNLGPVDYHLSPAAPSPDLSSPSFSAVFSASPRGILNDILTTCFGDRPIYLHTKIAEQRRPGSTRAALLLYCKRFSPRLLHGAGRRFLPPTSRFSLPG